MKNIGFNLADVSESIRKHSRRILILSSICAVLGGVSYLVTPKQYEAKTEFVIRNPLYSDRNYLYNYDTKFLDYFGNEDDANRIMMLASSDIVQMEVIKNTNLSKAYKLDTLKPKQLLKLKRKFDKNLTLLRTEYRDILLTYTDTDPKRAAKVANETVNVLEQTFEDFYGDMRRSMHQTILNKIVEEDSIINSLTDTLAKLREKYGIYDIISPARHNLMNGNMKENSHHNYGLGIELVQNIESLKDEMVADRAVKTTLANQYTSSYNTAANTVKMPILKVITEALPPATPKGLGGLYTVISCFLAGFFFSSIYVLASDSYFARKAKK